MNNHHIPGKHRRGSSPHQEKEIGFIGHQIELLFSDGAKDPAAPTFNSKRGRHERVNEQRAGASSDSAQTLSN